MEPNEIETDVNKDEETLNRAANEYDDTPDEVDLIKSIIDKLVGGLDNV